MHLYIFRHGESDGNAGRSDSRDSDLTPLGRRQAQRSAARLAAFDVELLMCSPTIRGLASAARLRVESRLPVEVWPDWTEVGFLGPEPGLTGAEIRQAYPDFRLDAQIREDRGWASDRTGESLPERYERAVRLLERLRVRFSSGHARLGVVSHGGFGSIFLCAFLGLPVEALPEGPPSVFFSLYNMSLTHLQWDGGEGRIIHRVNDVSHLDVEEHTQTPRLLSLETGRAASWDEAAG